MMETRLAVGARAGLVSALLTLGVGSGTYADVVTDGTVGMPGFLGNPQTLTAPAITIPQDFGSAVGTNLFHSFETFNINVGQRVTFTATDLFNNVISRVTGPDASTINGLLKSEVTGADFWFINPNGIAFGVGASLDVPASFHASTADYLTLGDCTASPATCGSFSATNPPGSTLVTADPSAFGFLDSAISPIAVDGSELIVASSETLSLVGLLGGDQPTDGIRNADIQAIGGQVNLISVASAGVAFLSSTPLEPPDTGGFASFGGVDLVNTSIDTGVGNSPTLGGAIFIRGGVLVLDSTDLLANTTGSGSAGIIDINVANLTAKNSTNSVAYSSRLQARSSALEDPTDPSFSPGSPGTVSIRANRIELRDLTQISVDTNDGEGGSIGLYADTVEIKDSSLLSATTGGKGQGGLIRIGGRDSTETALTAADSLLLSGQGDIPVFSSIRSDSSSEQTDAGGAGTVEVAADSIKVIDSGGVFVTTRSGKRDDGGGGRIDFYVEDFLIADGGVVAAATFGSGPGGDINIWGIGSTATSPILANSVRFGGTDEGDRGRISFMVSQSYAREIGAGRPGNVTIYTSDFSMGLNSQIFTATEFGGNLDPITGEPSGGNIKITADDIYLTNSLLSAGVGAGGRGISGNIELSATTFSMDGGLINAPTQDGIAGDIVVTADDVVIRGDARISAPTDGTGNGGNIIVNARDVDFGGSAVLTVETKGNAADAGNAGTIQISVEKLQMTGGSFTASTVGFGDGGNITVVAVDSDPADGNLSGNVTVRNGAGIVASTTGPGNAGSIDITAEEVTVSESVSVSTGRLDSGIRSLGAGPASGNAGQINVTAGLLRLENEGDIVVAAVNGRSGGVTANVDRLEVTTGGIISAATNGRGQGGVIVVQGRQSTIANTTVASQVLVNGRSTSGVISGIRSDSGGTDAANSGPAGTITIRSQDVQLADGGYVFAPTFFNRGGAITMDVGSLTVSGGSVIAASSLVSGDAGSITLNIDSLRLDDGGRIQATTSDGNGGNVEITAREVVVGHGAGINADTFGVGKAGTINLNVSDLRLDGGVVTASSFASGDGGTIRVEGLPGESGGNSPADSVIVNGVLGDSGLNGIFARSFGIGATAGAAGNIWLRAKDVQLNEHTLVLADTIDGGRLDAITQRPVGGNITVLADSISLVGSAIRTISYGAADSGSISLEGDLSIWESLINSDANGSGNAGDISLNVGTLLMGNSSAVTANTTGGGDAGAIRVQGLGSTVNDRRAASVIFVDGLGVNPFTALESFISTSSTETASGRPGQIDLFADSISLVNGARVSASTVNADGVAGSGSVAIAARDMSITSRSLVAASTTGDGDAGSVSVAAETLNLLDGGRIEATTTGAGSGGNVSLGSASDPIGTLLVSGRSEQMLVMPGRGVVYDTTRPADFTYSTIPTGQALIPGEIASLLYTRAATGFAAQYLAYVAAFDNTITGGPGPDLVARSESLVDDGSSPFGTNAPAVRGFIAPWDPDFRIDVSGSPDSPFIGGHTQSGDYSVNFQFIAPTTVRAPPLASAITSSSTAIGGTAGAAGSVNINVGTVTVSDEGRIAVNTRDGAAGSILVDAGQVTITNNGQISVAALGGGDAGSVRIQGLGPPPVGGDSLLLRNGQIDAQALEGNGGSVLILTANEGVGRVRLDSGTILAVSNSDNPNASQGDILIAGPDSTIEDPDNSTTGPRRVILENGSLISANSGNPNAGNVTVNARAIAIDGTSAVRATGDVFTIGSVLGSTQEIPEAAPVDASDDLATRCTPAEIGGRSTFVVSGTRPADIRAPYFPVDGLASAAMGNQSAVCAAQSPAR